MEILKIEEEEYLMKSETESEKQNRIFNHYKNRLLKSAIGNKIRFIVIEYLCSFPKINPYEMAKSIILDGYDIVFDDASIIRMENIMKRKRIYID